MLYRSPFWLLAFALAWPLHAAAPLPANEQYRGSKVEWARLKTVNRFWDQHSDRDSHVLGLMRSNTTLNITSTWHSADIGDLKDLCSHPFIFAQSIAGISDDDGARLAEYLRRGGFILIDACVRISVNPDSDAYLAAQLSVLTKQFPNLRVEPLRPEHEIFSIYFKMRETPPQYKSGSNVRWGHGGTEPLRGFYVGDRLAGIISLSGFQCGWTGLGQTATDSVRMVSNIYIYAMTH
jgi:hypothetical protein